MVGLGVMGTCSMVFPMLVSFFLRENIHRWFFTMLGVAVFTGQAEQMDARADRMDAELDRQVEARSKQIEAHAAAMCDEARHLYAVQQSLDYRLDDGRPLELLRVRSDAEDVQATVAAPSAPTAPAMDAKPSTAIAPKPVPARRQR